jgi:hypothetical protein
MNTVTHDPPPPQSEGGQPHGGQLQDMNRSAAVNASPSQGGVQPCIKKSWFAIRVVDDKNAVVEGLTLKLKLTGLGETERITSKGNDPLKVDQLDPGGTGEVVSIQSPEGVWEAVGALS